MHRTAWVLQVLLGLYFLAIGVMHFAVPEGLPEPMAWMHDLPTWAHSLAGTAEILGGLGLILPGLARIRTELVPLAAAALAVLMVLAAGWHLLRGELPNIAGNLVMVGLLAFVAYVRWSRHPLPSRQDKGAEPQLTLRPRGG